MTLLVSFVIFLSNAQASQCLDSMNLKSEKWLATKNKLEKLKEKLESIDKAQLERQKGVKQAGLLTPFVWLSAAYARLGIPMMVYAIISGEMSCDDQNRSKYAESYESCDKVSDGFSHEFGFLPKTKEFLRLSDPKIKGAAGEREQALELLLHPEYCEAILNSYEQFYPNYTLQCGRQELTLVNSRQNSSIKVNWREDDQISSIDEGNLSDPLDAFRINFLAGQPTFVNFIEGKKLTSENKSRRADFAKMENQEIQFNKIAQAPARVQERYSKFKAKLLDVLEMKSCCEKQPENKARCAEVMPKQSMVDRAIAREKAK